MCLDILKQWISLWSDHEQQEEKVDQLYYKLLQVQ